VGSFHEIQAGSLHVKLLCVHRLNSKCIQPVQDMLSTTQAYGTCTTVSKFHKIQVPFFGFSNYWPFSPEYDVISSHVPIHTTKEEEKARRDKKSMSRPRTL
jgi:hypothetical protein